ncbi:calcium-binding protein [Ruegeria aquimaris]|uniref:Bifunctional hemolysin/adenylate cyclase n=1 Tax=Ruegeria aquimaris TaxID=2984333 RepID=A0ABT3AII2_9RHOB|nr:calcium-binding protein [Ruegeria sp. XHP0148]MCV2888464.1 hypothetical protein [Ruegeria sp. XHP0148]
MTQSIFLEERFAAKNLNLTPDDGSSSTWQVLSGGGVAVATLRDNGASRVLTYTVFGSDGEAVGTPQTLATVPREDGLLDVGFVEAADGSSLLHFTLVDGTSYGGWGAYAMGSGDHVQSTLRIVRLESDGSLDGTQDLATFDTYIPRVRPFGTSDGGIGLLRSGTPKPWESVGGGGYTVASIPDPDTLLQRFGADGTPIGDPLVWANPGAGYLDRDIGYVNSRIPEAIDHVQVFEGADGTLLAVYPRPWDDRGGFTEELSSLTVRTIGADGSQGMEHVVFQSPYSESNTMGTARNGDLGGWMVVADPAGGFVVLYGEAVYDAPPEGPTVYDVSIRMQRLDATGAVVGADVEVARYTNSYISWLGFHDAEMRADGTLLFLTSVLGNVTLHSVARGDTGGESVMLRSREADDAEGAIISAEIREDGGVSILHQGVGPIVTEYGDREDVLWLSTYDAQGQLESPTVRLADHRNIWAKFVSGPDGLLTVAWQHAGEAGETYVGQHLDGQGFRHLTPTALTDAADDEALSEPAFVDGKAGNDTLTGSAGDDRFLGGAGDDLLRGEAGDDMFRADAGNDTLIGGEGTDTAFWLGSPTDYTGELLDEADIPEHLRGMGPVYAVTGRNDRAGDGRNLLLGVERIVFADRVMTPDELVIQTGRETGAFDELLEGAEDVNDTLSGGFGADTLRGLGGNDSLSGDEENDLLEGGAGDDTLIGGQGVDVLEGGEGDDVAVFSGEWGDYEFYLTDDPRFAGSIPDLPEGITLSGPAVVVKARDTALGDDQWDFLVDIEQMQFSNRSGSVFDILLDAGAYNRTIRGTVADDTIAGGVGHDDINGDSGSDIIFGGPGNDTLDGDFGNDALNGGLGNDDLDGGFGDDTLDGGPGDDALFSGGSEGAGDLLRGGDGNDVLSSWWGSSTLEGGTGDDTIQGGSDANLGFGEDGDDQLSGHEGNDTLDGGEGADEVNGDDGNDSLLGQGGDDTLNGGRGEDSLFGGAGNDALFGGTGRDELHGGDGNDLIRGAWREGDPEDDLADTVYAGAGNDTIDGGHGNDLIYGMDGDDVIAGGFGADQLIGQGGNDVITGSAFSDLIFGNAGDDFLNGGFGHDRINGGTGADKFFHLGVAGHGSDWVQDYNSAEGDVLVFGNASATRGDFQVNLAHTANAEGERAGDDAVQEAFVIYRPTGQIMWALVDGGGQSSINLQIGADVFDLLT